MISTIEIVVSKNEPGRISKVMSHTDEEQEE
jgi:hypothetical protein